MLFQLGHGHCVVAHSNQEARPDGTTLAAVRGRNGNAKRGAPPLDFGAFGYYFRDAPEAFPGKNTTRALDALGDAMAEPPESARPDSRIPVIFTYLGQFIDHDISAGTDRDAGLSMIDGGDIAPAPRELVMRDRLNLRAGALRLDSLYGDSPDQEPFSRKLASLLRDPDARAKMWLGELVDTGHGRVPLPEDGSGDLLRLGRLLEEPHKQLDEAVIRALPEPFRRDFINQDGSIRTQRAMIGDARNDENLILAQLHLAFLRFHNRVVDAGSNAGGPHREGDDAVYNWARQLVRWHYQWLVLNAYLPKVCDPSVVADVLGQGAPLYSKFYGDQMARAANALPPGHMPLPLEFSAAAFRFGHSMVRASYDLNRYFGRPANSEGLRDTRADLEQLFAYTGNGARPMPAPEGGSHPGLPGHWAPEWERLVDVHVVLRDRATRRIDTLLAPPLTDMSNAPTDAGGLFRRLARRNLRRGYRLNIPSAQDCIAGIYARTGAAIDTLGADELTSGPTGEAVREGGFVTRTPLWFYILKEAEICADGQHLGPLGSRLVAETLAGLVINDKTSYWNQIGSGAGRWHPRDAVTSGERIVDSMSALLRAARVLK